MQGDNFVDAAMELESVGSTSRTPSPARPEKFVLFINFYCPNIHQKKKL